VRHGDQVPGCERGDVVRCQDDRADTGGAAPVLGVRVYAIGVPSRIGRADDSGRGVHREAKDDAVSSGDARSWNGDAETGPGTLALCRPDAFYESYGGDCVLLRDNH
jgi:hypothetical protein